MDTFTLSQIDELRAIEKTRLDRGEPGIRVELQELINRLKSGGVAGKSADVRIARAKRMFDLGVGRELFTKGKLPNESFEAYLATIPEIPVEYLVGDPDFEHLVLEEPRIGLKRLCDLGIIVFDGNDQTFEAWDSRHEDAMEPRWIRLQDGRKNRKRKPDDCRQSFNTDELGTTALQGVCAYLQIPTVVADLNIGADGHVMDLPGSVHRGGRRLCAFLFVGGGRAGLYWYWDGVVGPQFGSSSRRECRA